MKRYRNESEYSLPGDEYTLPPEQPETLLDKSRYPGAFSAPSESRAEAEERVKPTLLLTKVPWQRRKKRMPHRRLRAKQSGSAHSFCRWRLSLPPWCW